MATENLTQMPAGVAPYKRTSAFTSATVPAGLTKDHATKEGVWGMINVLRGQLIYTVPSKGIKIPVAAGETTVIEPAVAHRVSLEDEAEFFVEFWR